METRIIRLLTYFGLWIFTILSVSSQTMPDKLRTESPIGVQCEFLYATSSNSKTNTPAPRHHQFSTNSSSHHAIDQAIEQVEETSVRKDDSAPQADRSTQQGFHPRWHLGDPIISVTALPSYTIRLANQMAVRTERYILFQDFRI